ncbi:MAG: 23S rRNA (guanosine(2251)-2'-O)-methyltransferase RlmB [Candidatus Methylomirabilales bacterium]
MKSGEPVELLCGPRPVLEALRAGRRRVRRIFLARQGAAEPVAALLALARAQGVPVEALPREGLDRRAGGGGHHGVLAEVGAFPYAEAETLLEAAAGDRDAFLVVLDGIQDPQNLGAILRTAEAAGVQAVALPRDRAAAVTAAAARASAGAAEHLRVARVTNLATFLAALKERGVWVVGADPDGERDLYRADLTGPLAVVIGSEGRGLRPLTKSRCDFLVRIPLGGRVASLNAAAAAAVCLFEAVRQRRAKLQVSVDRLTRQ